MEGLPGSSRVRFLAGACGLLSSSFFVLNAEKYINYILNFNLPDLRYRGLGSCSHAVHAVDEV
jgi:hypothetical protein